jgi:hypothetical protein
VLKLTTVLFYGCILYINIVDTYVYFVIERERDICPVKITDFTVQSQFAFMKTDGLRCRICDGLTISHGNAREPAPSGTLLS